MASDRRPGEDLVRFMRRMHKEKHPSCTYGDEPHYVPPGGSTIGFYLCAPPEDIRNHVRCRPPFNHEHEAHFDAFAGMIGDRDG